MKRLTLTPKKIVSPKEVTCKHCGSEQVQWVDTGAGWRLYDIGGRRHFCEGFRESTAMATVRHTAAPQRVLTALTEEFDILIADEVELTRDRVKYLFEKAKANAVMRVAL